MMKAIILNGPPGSGKDVIAKEIAKQTDMVHLEFKDELYTQTAILFKVKRDEIKSWNENREIKNLPHPMLVLDYQSACQLYTYLGKVLPRLASHVPVSPREALIFTSELYIKRVHGVDYFGKFAADAICEKGAVFSDGGFPEEVVPVADRVGAPELLMVRLSREGTSFEGDSRDYVTAPEGVKTLVLENDGTIEEAAQIVLEAAGLVEIKQVEEEVDNSEETVDNDPIVEEEQEVTEDETTTTDSGD